MGRAPCCDKANVKKGPWSPEEDAKLKDYIDKHATGGNWIALPQKAGLKRCGKSCRLRWLNYLRPNIRHGDFTEDEDRIICTLFASIGSRWSVIAAQLPGRTDNDIKNYWNTKLKKKILLHRRSLFPQQSSHDSYPSPSISQCSKLFPRSYEDHHHQQPMLVGSSYYNNPSGSLPSLEAHHDHNDHYYMNSAHGNSFTMNDHRVKKDCSNNLLIYGNEAASSSSDGSCVSNNHANDYSNHLGLQSNYFGNYVVDNHGCSLAAAQGNGNNDLFSREQQIISSFDYSIEEIKQLMSSGVSNYCNNFNFFVSDDFKTEEEEEEEVILDK